jgi:hypothetical protein
MRTTVRLPEELLNRAKEKARRDGSTLTALIEKGLRMAVTAPPARRRRAPPPVSRARGGLRPGINITKTSELLELDNEGVAAEKLR